MRSMLKATVFTGQLLLWRYQLVSLHMCIAYTLLWIWGRFHRPIIHIVYFDDLDRIEFWLPSTVIIIIDISLLVGMLVLLNDLNFSYVAVKLEMRFLSSQTRLIRCRFVCYLNACQSATVITFSLWSSALRWRKQYIWIWQRLIENLQVLVHVDWL
jgi:hypothetical protein